MYDNIFEKDPGSIETKGERDIAPSEDFTNSFSDGVPEFGGEQFGKAHEGNNYYGEVAGDENETDYNESVADAASLINYGLDAVAREKGVEAVVQGIKSFDASGSDNPLKDLFDHLGFNSTEEFKDLDDESDASKAQRARFQEECGAPKTQTKSREGMLKAIADMKELILEVESADPRYDNLREAAKAAQKGYFEYAVQEYGTRGLTELFSELAKQKEISEKENKENSPEKEEGIGTGTDLNSNSEDDSVTPERPNSVSDESQKTEEKEEKQNNPNPPAKLKFLML